MRSMGPDGRLWRAIAIGEAVLIVCWLAFSSLVQPVLDARADDPGAPIVVEDVKPANADPAMALKRLNADDKVAWGARVFPVIDAFGPDLLEDNRSRLAAVGVVPDPSMKPLAVTTNSFDPDSVRRNGTLWIVQGDVLPLLMDWLKTDPKVFTDAALDARRKALRAGPVVAFYVPGEVDRTDWLKGWLSDVALCPTTAAPCEVRLPRS